MQQCSSSYGFGLAAVTKINNARINGTQKLSEEEARSRIGQVAANFAKNAADYGCREGLKSIPGLLSVFYFFFFLVIHVCLINIKEKNIKNYETVYYPQDETERDRLWETCRGQTLKKKPLKKQTQLGPVVGKRERESHWKVIRCRRINCSITTMYALNCQGHFEKKKVNNNSCVITAVFPKGLKKF
jgi:hypothetical protein